MVIQRNCDFISNTSSPIISKPFFNSTGDILALQITGADGQYVLEGRNSTSHNWAVLAGINLSDFSVAAGGFSKEGLYEIGIVGVREMRVRVVETSGEVSITGQIISTEES